MSLKFPALIAMLSLSVLSGAMDTDALVGPPQRHTVPALTDLRSVDELKTLFNQDRGKPRFVLLLSPT